jgi:hypothetical protein
MHIVCAGFRLIDRNGPMRQLNLKSAVCDVPSVNVTVSRRQVFAHAFSVFMTSGLAKPVNGKRDTLGSFFYRRCGEGGTCAGARSGIAARLFARCPGVAKRPAKAWTRPSRMNGAPGASQ